MTVERVELREFRVPAPSWAATRHFTVADIELTALALVDAEAPVPVAIVTERGDNPGLSITNNAEAVVERVRTRYGPAVVVVEHYGPDSYAGGAAALGRWPDDYDQVDIGPEALAVWRYLGRDRVSALTRLAELLRAPASPEWRWP